MNLPPYLSGLQKRLQAILDLMNLNPLASLVKSAGAKNQ